MTEKYDGLNVNFNQMTNFNIMIKSEKESKYKEIAAAFTTQIHTISANR